MLYWKKSGNWDAADTLQLVDLMMRQLQQLPSHPLLHLERSLAIRREAAITRVEATISYSASGAPSCTVTAATASFSASSSWLEAPYPFTPQLLPVASPGCYADARSSSISTKKIRRNKQQHRHNLQRRLPSAIPSSISEKLLAAVSTANTQLAAALICRDCTNQADIDKRLRECNVADTYIVLLVSSAVCKLGAAVRRVPLFEHITDLRNGAETARSRSSYVMPMPLAMISARHYVIPHHATHKTLSSVIETVAQHVEQGGLPDPHACNAAIGRRCDVAEAASAVTKEATYASCIDFKDGGVRHALHSRTATLR